MIEMHERVVDLCRLSSGCMSIKAEPRHHLGRLCSGRSGCLAPSPASPFGLGQCRQHLDHTLDGLAFSIRHGCNHPRIGRWSTGPLRSRRCTGPWPGRPAHRSVSHSRQPMRSPVATTRVGSTAERGWTHGPVIVERRVHSVLDRPVMEGNAGHRDAAPPAFRAGGSKRSLRYYDCGWPRRSRCACTAPQTDPRTTGCRCDAGNQQFLPFEMMSGSEHVVAYEVGTTWSATVRPTHADRREAIVVVKCHQDDVDRRWVVIRVHGAVV